MSNTFGSILRIITFGESHGVSIGGVIDGFPAGFKINIGDVQKKLNFRRPGFSNISTERKEDDNVEFSSGLVDGVTTGAPIAFMIKNNNQNHKDYSNLKNIYRPSHADFTYEKKYGIRDFLGGGRSSARETACRVVAGEIASQFLKTKKIYIYSFVSSVNSLKLEKNYNELDLSKIYENDIRCPDFDLARKMKKFIEKTKEEGDSLGGCISTVVKGIPVGLGEPLYNKLNASLSFSIMSINAVKGIEFGLGFSSCQLKGSEYNDIFIKKDNKVETSSNNSGGIQGGISNGQDIYFKVAFKPTSSIKKRQNTVNNKGEEVSFLNLGRHDPCVLPRAVPVVEAMTAICLMDMYLLNFSSKIDNLKKT